MSRNGRRALTRLLRRLPGLPVPADGAADHLLVQRRRRWRRSRSPGLTTSWYEEAFARPQIRTRAAEQPQGGERPAAVHRDAARRARQLPAGPAQGAGSRSGVSALLLLPLVVPTVVLGVALLILFQRGFRARPARALGRADRPHRHRAALLRPAAHAAHREHRPAPRGGRATTSARRGFTTFRRVILPLITPAILSAFLIAFVVSIDEVVDRELPHQRSVDVSDLPLLGPASSPRRRRR